METMTNEQYDRVAAWLDGEPVTLTSAEQAVADEVRGGQAVLDEALGVPRGLDLPGRLYRNFQNQRASQRFARVRYALYGAAAAAALVIALLPALRPGPPDSVLPGPQNAAAAPLNADDFQPLAEVEQMDQQLKALEKDVAKFRAQGAADAPASSDEGDTPEQGPRG